MGGALRVGGGEGREAQAQGCPGLSRCWVWATFPSRSRPAPTGHPHSTGPQEAVHVIKSRPRSSLPGWVSPRAPPGLAGQWH